MHWSPIILLPKIILFSLKSESIPIEAKKAEFFFQKKISSVRLT